MKILNWLKWIFTGRCERAPDYGRVPIPPGAYKQLDRTGENLRLRNDLARVRKAAGFCAKHEPDGGARNCLVCGCERLSGALSKIASMCEGYPEVTAYDCHCNEDLVVKQVEELRSRALQMESIVKMIPLGYHAADDRGECLCSQCQLRRAAARALK